MDITHEDLIEAKEMGFRAQLARPEASYSGDDIDQITSQLYAPMDAVRAQKIEGLTNTILGE